MNKGFVHVYTGNGKGKTTAAVGLALRAIGAGMSVYIAQFIKKKPSNEMKALESFGAKVKIRQFGKGFVIGKPSPGDIKIAKKGLEEAEEAILSGEFRVIILDEANMAIQSGLLEIEELLEIIKKKPEEIELIITGRDADENLIEAADLVTEMREVKHYHIKGIKARKGIEY